MNFTSDFVGDEGLDNLGFGIGRLTERNVFDSVFIGPLPLHRWSRCSPSRPLKLENNYYYRKNNLFKKNNKYLFISLFYNN